MGDESRFEETLLRGDHTRTRAMELEAARRLALGLMREHRVPGDWLFEFDRSKVRFGRCHYGRKEISLSRHLVELNDEAEVRDTILHEIAHALGAGLGMGRSGGGWRKRLVACRGDVTAKKWCGRVRGSEGRARRVGRWCIGIDGR